MKGRALLFGLNYAHCSNSKLNGCINDVYSISEYIKNTLAIPTSIFTDDVDLYNTSYDGILKNLYEIAVKSYKEDLEFVWIHYSGHGSNQRDTSGDELDGMDEGLVPSDYEKKGILIDDIINHVFESFNPKTKILFVCDACHSGTMVDLTYLWNTYRDYSVENKNCMIKANTMLISGCKDNQTSADAYNVAGDNKYVGAMTANFIKVLKRNPEYIYNVFKCVEAINMELRKGSYTQIPMISTNYDLLKNPSMVLENKDANYQEPAQYPYQNYNQTPPQTQQNYLQQYFYKPPSNYYKPPSNYYKPPSNYYKPSQYYQSQYSNKDYNAGYISMQPQQNTYYVAQPQQYHDVYSMPLQRVVYRY